MFHHYFLIAWRQIRRHAIFSSLNIFCLAVGIGACLLIGQYVGSELSVNSRLKDASDLYMINSDWKPNSGGLEITTVGPLAKTLKDKYPTLVRDYYRMNPVTNVISAGDLHFQENIAIGDTTLVNMLGFELVHGNPKNAFPNNSSVLITEKLARKLFNTSDAIGKTITINNAAPGSADYHVSGVLKDLPKNSVLNYLDKTGYSAFVPFEGNRYYGGSAGEENWQDFYTVGFIKMQPGKNPKLLADPVKQLLKTNSPETISNNLTVKFKPLSTYYLDANNGAVGKTLKILSFVAAGILLLAMINFINIMVGSASHRMREIGLRKVFGSNRLQLIGQYLSEAVSMAFFSGLVALCLYLALRPRFNQIWDTQLPSIGQFSPAQFLVLLGFLLLTGLLAGAYPALKLSAMSTVNSVKGKFAEGEKSNWLARSLLVLQFTLTAGVFIFSVTLSKQVKYFFEKDQGYNRDQLLVVTAFPKRWDSVGVSHMENVRSSLLRLPGVQNASISFEIPNRTFNDVLIYPEGSDSSQSISVQTNNVDNHFGQTYGIKLLEGRFFKADGEGFTPGEAVITESTRKAFGWTSAVGKRIYFRGFPNPDVVVGVTADFNSGNMTKPIGPGIMFNMKDMLGYRYMSVKLSGGSIPQTLDRIKSKWKDLSPNAPFEYSFMDDKFNEVFSTELRLRKAASISTVLMSLIVGLGIFGLLSQSLARRKREIAVRKVLGAELIHIVAVFARQYALLIGLGLVIACPLAYLLTSNWLEQYAYRIDQSVWTYLSVILTIGLGSLLLIGLQCVKTALSNPVDSLKNE